MANRFEGNLTTGSDKETARVYGIPPAKLEALDVRGELSESGSGTDMDFGENYSSTAGSCYYTATADCVIHSMHLFLENGDYDETGVMDGELFLGGATALTNGIKWKVWNKTPTAVFTSTAATNINGFVDEWGADVVRHTGHLSATNNINHDTVYVHLDFVKLFGFPIRLPSGFSIGIYLNDNISALSAFRGTVFGRLIFD